MSKPVPAGISIAGRNHFTTGRAITPMVIVDVGVDRPRMPIRSRVKGGPIADSPL